MRRDVIHKIVFLIFKVIYGKIIYFTQILIRTRITTAYHVAIYFRPHTRNLNHKVHVFDIFVENQSEPWSKQKKYFTLRIETDSKLLASDMQVSEKIRARKICKIQEMITNFTNYFFPNLIASSQTVYGRNFSSKSKKAYERLRYNQKNLCGFKISYLIFSKPKFATILSS